PKEGQQSEASHARREGCCSPCLDALPCPLPPLHLPCECFLLSTSLVAEMRGSMAVLSDSTIGTTILLALPLSAPNPPTKPLLPTSPHCSPLLPQVAEMRGSMAVLSDSAIGTTILLALPLAAPPPPTEPGSSSCRRGEGREGHPITPSSPVAPLSPVSLRLQTMPQLALPSARGSIGSIGSSLGGSGRGGSSRGGVGGILGGDGYGAHVLLLASGEHALQAVSSPTSAASPIHLLLLDLHMPPGIDGFETARRIRRMESELLAAAERQLPSVAEATAADEAEATAANEAANEFTFHTPRESTPADCSDSDFSFQTPQESTAANKAEEEELGGSAKSFPQRLCIIALTADLDVGVKRACFEAGMDGAVRKPIVAHELLDALIHAGFVAVETDDEFCVD
ncbi:unnamed protein product, partial [Closterium sp. Yama58-4]